MNKHIVQLIRERFYPLVRFGNSESSDRRVESRIPGKGIHPLFAGDFRLK